MRKSKNQTDFYSAFHKKALEIGMLSKAISDYLSKDLSSLTSTGTENPHIYFSGDIVQQSVSLSEEIVKAERCGRPEKRQLHIQTLGWLTYRLIQNCKRLEHCQSNGRDFMPILRQELKKFKSLQRHWVMMF